MEGGYQRFMRPGTPRRKRIWPVFLAAVLVPAAPARADFEKDVAPVLVRRCVACHNAAEAKGGLDLTARNPALRGGDSGPAVVPGKADDSYLIERVAEGSMPPKKADRLTAAEVTVLRRWVADGAKWPERRVLSAFEFTSDRRAGFDWWSLQPLGRPAVPEVKNRAWVRDPIDAFVLAKLEARGLAPAPEADRATFARRATFDLIGLPPTPEEIDAFVSDRSPGAYAKLIDRLLASPHHGERWGRHWLDVVRFGESDGFENDKMREHAWRYRDYVIASFNADKPYPQFVREQIAGDVLAPVTRDGIAASGFLVAGPWDEIQNVAKSPVEKRRAREEQMEELVGTVAQAFLGVTANCARCHDHKFDPIPQSDYYRLKAVFAGVDHGNRPLFTPDEQRDYETKTAPLRTRIADLRKRLDALTAGSGDAMLSMADAKPLVEGRFGKALDSKIAYASTRSRAAYHTPPITVECWAKVFSKTGFNILVANNVKTSGEHWELYTYVGSGAFSA